MAEAGGYPSSGFWPAMSPSRITRTGAAAIKEHWYLTGLAVSFYRMLI